ncbi:hypothetical protein [Stieleria varia]|uniref:hypothetical protein n=1 Tax=Stieleria varia TaxID=2528005 RepID=UPI0011B4CF14|nr:hypothetical protein [Stieleria varia]
MATNGWNMESITHVSPPVLSATDQIVIINILLSDSTSSDACVLSITTSRPNHRALRRQYNRGNRAAAEAL